MIELSQRFYFEAAHTLARKIDSDGSLRVHGHTYLAEVAITGVPNVHTGMITDLGLLRQEIEQIRAILEAHNPLEEDRGGFYEVVEQLAAEELSSLMEKVRAFPPVRVAPHADTEVTRWSIEELVRQAEEGRRSLKS